MAYCAKCNDYFYREVDEAWKKLCIPCWRKEKMAQDYGSGLNKILSSWNPIEPASSAENLKLKAENSLLKSEIFFLNNSITTLNHDLAAVRAKASQNNNSFIKDNIKALLMLCHPDKHNNSKRATAVTSWLIDFKRRI